VSVRRKERKASLLVMISDRHAYDGSGASEVCGSES
jgi:hypothetical protein